MQNTKTAKLVWEGNGLAFAATGGSGYSMRFDNPSGPKGASPMEVVAMAAGGCTAADVIDILRKKRQDVTGFEVNVVGLRSSEHPMVFTEIDLEYVVRGRSIDPKAVERSIELSLTKYCSVNSMLQHSVKINSRYRIIEEAQPEPAAA
ncbi:MAG TPA: OsmC family protein [Anaerolineales bacterium]|nr:OsmC family protein [Anaerolineales bacterium]